MRSCSGTYIIEGMKTNTVAVLKTIGLQARDQFSNGLPGGPTSDRARGIVRIDEYLTYISVSAVILVMMVEECLPEYSSLEKHLRTER